MSTTRRGRGDFVLIGLIFLGIIDYAYGNLKDSGLAKTIGSETFLVLEAFIVLICTVIYSFYRKGSGKVYTDIGSLPYADLGLVLALGLLGFMGQRSVDEWTKDFKPHEVSVAVVLASSIAEVVLLLGTQNEAWRSDLVLAMVLSIAGWAYVYRSI